MIWHSDILINTLIRFKYTAQDTNEKMDIPIKHIDQIFKKYVCISIKKISDELGNIISVMAEIRGHVSSSDHK